MASTKTRNAVGTPSLARKAIPDGASDQIVYPIAANGSYDPNLAISLVYDTCLNVLTAG